jgi:hypothetical protein
MGMLVRARIAVLLTIVLVAIFTCWLRPAGGDEDPWRGLAKSIMSTGRPDSTAVLALLDEDAVESLRSQLPTSFKVVPIGHPDVPSNDAFVRAQLGQMYREVSAATRSYPDLWVVGTPSGSTRRMQAARIAELAASLIRSRVLRDSVRTPRGTVVFSRWVDRPGGAAQRAEMSRAQAYADSVLARGTPKPIPIRRPFDPSELEINPDTLSYYVGRLADTSFYSIGGCSEVELVSWSASERLGELGPGVVPALIERMADPNPFVRERVQEALLFVTQDERVLARTNGEYLKFYDRPASSSRDIVKAWWAKYGHFWVSADSSR